MVVDLENPSSHRICHLLIILLLYFSTFSQQACNPGDQEALLAFSNSLSSSLAALNWSSATDCCTSWEGIGCDDNGRVTRLWVPSRRFGGTISPLLRNLSVLTHLNLSCNSLHGFLPDGLFSSLNRLEVLDLSYNRLFVNLSASFSSTGSFPPTIRVVDISVNRFHGSIEPSWFSSASSLTSFNASDNGFTGQFPSSICISAPLLNTLDFTRNTFSGQIPVGLGRCSQLEVFRVGCNNLSGLIPSDIYSLNSLVELSVGVNHLSGTIGGGLLNLTNLRILELNFNNFTGEIPPDIDKLSKLEHLVLHKNLLTGFIPPSLMNCTNLVKLTLRGNLLQGNLSTVDFSRLVRLQKLDLGDNDFTGNLPESLYSCKELTAIGVADSRLTGQISPKIAALPSLSFLCLSNNNFTHISEAFKILAGCKSLTTLILSQNFYDEELPGDESFIGLDGFKSLKVLALRECRFRGQVPAWLVHIKTLEVLDFSHNQITGKIPKFMGTFPRFFYLDLSYNRLTGELPVQLSNLPALISQIVTDKWNRSYLELPVFISENNVVKRQYNQLESLRPGILLKENNLSGEIPVEISRLKNLHALDLSGNYFSGNIPPEFSNLTVLEKLDLSWNNLTGEIPVSLQSLTFLSTFNVSYNDLEGPIPTGLETFFAECSYDGNPRLCGRVITRKCSSLSGSPTEEDQHDVGVSQDKESFVHGFRIGIPAGFATVLLIVAFLAMTKDLLH